MRIRNGFKVIAMLLVLSLFAISPEPGAGAKVYAQSYRYHQVYVYPRTYVYPRYHNPQAGKKKALKRIGIGTAIGVGAGGLIGGGSGALIGGALGAGGGTLFHFHKKHQYERRYYHYHY
jgi:hypothetical protein